MVAADALAFLRRGESPERFDIVFADPPYAACGTRNTEFGARNAERGSGGDRDWTRQLLAAMATAGILAEDGLFVMEERAAAGTGGGVACGWETVVDRVYGDARLRILRRNIE